MELKVAIHDAKHFGHKGFIGHNPGIGVVPLKDADFIWYHTTGDGPNVQRDLDDIAKTNKPVIAIITGDDKPQRIPTGHIFGTCIGWNVPYEYDQFIPYFLAPDELERIHRISFTGSNTWKNRGKMAVDGVNLTWVDWWKAKDKTEMRKRYVQELQQSVFSLCPRGNGRSSMRLWESMLLGAIPVRLDDWTRPFFQDMPFSPQYDLDKKDMREIVSELNAKADSEITSMREEMKAFVEKFLVRDYREGCSGTIGYTNWIKEMVC